MGVGVDDAWQQKSNRFRGVQMRLRVSGLDFGLFIARFHARAQHSRCSLPRRCIRYFFSLFAIESLWFMTRPLFSEASRVSRCARNENVARTRRELFLLSLSPRCCRVRARPRDAKKCVSARSQRKCCASRAFFSLSPHAAVCARAFLVFWFDFWPAQRNAKTYLISWRIVKVCQTLFRPLLYPTSARGW